MKLNDKIFNQIIYNIEFIRCCDIVTFDSFAFDFIKLHYCLGRRTDSDFWIDNRNPETIPDRLNHQLEMLRTRPTNRMDLRQMRPTFGESSYHQILFGLDFVPDLTGEDFTYPYKDLAGLQSTHIASQLRRELETLPEHRDLITSIYASAMREQKKA